MAGRIPKKVKSELEKMKVGEVRHVRVAPGRTGLYTIKKGKKAESLVDMSRPRRAKLISRKK